MDELLAVIKIFAGNFAPRSFMFCQGQLLSIAQNTAVFSLLGTTYGGNGQTTFGLPDLRGRVPIGQGQGAGTDFINLGQIAGTSTISLTLNNLPVHTHTATGVSTTSTNVKVSNKVGDSSDPRGKVLAQGVQIGSGPNATKLKPYVAYDALDTTNNGDLAGVSSTTTTSVNSGITGANIPINIMQPYLGINYIICLEGIYPSRN
ncbi:phage tail protein [Empedobacter falsenii]|uniref:phage tail protein n=1 Tax=Empedobacter falsenii TaxID=343874 RepID=UPI00257518F6|nr:tail fiber protein [Empedobacter falsenii]MDM1298795.1 phage tail protein [Empedobacter falsenii]MDM1318595.1 phage tail protein [Empedobacter falsenii]